MITKKPKIDLERLKVKIMMGQPFFGALLHRVTFKENENCPTAGIDADDVVHFGPDFYNSLKEAEQIGLATHEIFHAAFKHYLVMFAYASNEDRMLANQAADYLINFMINEMGITLPPGALLDSKYTPDKYNVNTLVEELRKQQKGKKQGGQGVAGEMKGACQGNDISNVGTPKTEAEIRQDVQEAKMAVSSAAIIAKKAGKLPGVVERFVSDMIKPQQSWQEELAAWFNVRIRDVTTWARPNRKYVSRGLYLPSKYSVGCGHIGIAIDVSGSIGEKELAVFGSEINFLFEQCKPSKVTVVYFDTRVQKVQEFDEFPIELRTCGGGGTNFGVAFEHFNNIDEPITGLVFMTDMYGDWPEEPSYPVCVLSTTAKMEAPFGKTIYSNLGE
jgi:predicted metal-dependent peptidase